MKTIPSCLVAASLSTLLPAFVAAQAPLTPKDALPKAVRQLQAARKGDRVVMRSTPTSRRRRRSGSVVGASIR